MRLIDKASPIIDMVQSRNGSAKQPGSAMGVMNALRPGAGRRPTKKQLAIPHDNEDLDFSPKGDKPSIKDPEWDCIMPKEKVHSLAVEMMVFEKIRKSILKFLIMPRNPNFHVGDYLILQESDGFLGELTGDWVIRQITFIVEDNASIIKNHAVISLANADEAKIIGSVFSTERLVEKNNRRLDWSIKSAPAPENTRTDVRS
jgi:hypothetical protein